MQKEPTVDQIKRCVLDGSVPVTFTYEPGLVSDQTLKEVSVNVSRFEYPCELLAQFIEAFSRSNPGVELPKVLLELPYIKSYGCMPFGVLFDISCMAARQVMNYPEMDERWRVETLPCTVTVRYAQPASPYLVNATYDEAATRAAWKETVDTSLHGMLGNSLLLKMDDNESQLYRILTSSWAGASKGMKYNKRSEAFNACPLRDAISVEEGALGEGHFMVWQLLSDGGVTCKDVAFECWGDESSNTLKQLLRHMIETGELDADWESFFEEPDDTQIALSTAGIHEVICHGIFLTPDVSLAVLQSCFFGPDLRVHLVIH